ncbi:MAG TPA: UvrD-helicase domain-containing protein [Azospirillaceae bacterium]|nr:UvrD-helicase domain-containing protein [Azospirillaceae bacterium]
MTNRAGKPDTPADIKLRTCLNNEAPTSFVMVAGAGAGKTTSLVKVLDHLGKTLGAKLRRRGQRIACITYTEVAEKEIWADVGNDPLFHVSTIHSFLWSLIKPFQEDIKSWVIGRIEDKLYDLEEKVRNYGPRTQERTKERDREDILRYQAKRKTVEMVSRFTYGTGSDYPKGILGHDDIIRMVPELIEDRHLLRSIVARKYPFVFVDESQDTSPNIVAALKSVDRQEGAKFCLGFFGDPMQKIYATGFGDIPLEDGWVKITKPENFRCPTSVLEVINRIRTPGDGLTQTQGRHEIVNGRLAPVIGSARMFILPADDFRGTRLRALRKWLAETNGDPFWLDEKPYADVKVLVIVHRMAALRLGFGNLYAALNDGAPSSLKDGFLDGTSWAIRPFLDYLLPLASASAEGNAFKVLTLLKANCPKMSKERVADSEPAKLLKNLREEVDVLSAMLSPTGDASILDIIRFVREVELAVLDERFAPHIAKADGDAGVEETEETATMAAYFACPASQLWGYRTYIEDESPFATQQGIKGAEYERVLVILDDEEGNHNQFSYDKFFGIASLSQTDIKNRAEGKDSVIERTRRLLYVCCSRAVRDLAVVLFARDIRLAEEKVRASGLFPAEDVRVFAGSVEA